MKDSVARAVSGLGEGIELMLRFVELERTGGRIKERWVRKMGGLDLYN